MSVGHHGCGRLGMRLHNQTVLHMGQMIFSVYMCLKSQIHAHQAQPTASVWYRGQRTASGFCIHSLSFEWQWPEYVMRTANFDTSLLVGPSDTEKSLSPPNVHRVGEPTAHPPYISARDITKYNRSLMDPVGGGKLCPNADTKLSCQAEWEFGKRCKKL